MGKNDNRTNKIKPFLQNFNFENSNYPLNKIPLKKEDYETFERNNISISLNTLKPDNEKQNVYYHFKSKNRDRENKIYLLLLENKHYTCVSKPHILSKCIKN